MNFDEQSVGTHGHCATAERNHEIRASATLAGIDDDWQMRFLLGDGDGRQIEGIAGVGLESSDAALAEQDIGFPCGRMYSAGEQPFLDALAHAALEKDRLAASAPLR